MPEINICNFFLGARYQAIITSLTQQLRGAVVSIVVSERNCTVIYLAGGYPTGLVSLGFKLSTSQLSPAEMFNIPYLVSLLVSKVFNSNIILSG